LQVKVDHEQAHEGQGISMLWVYVSLVGLLVVLIGANVGEPARTWIWVGAIGVDFLAAGLAGRDAVWDLHPGHFSERHGLFVIIALGESLIVAGTAVAGDDRTTDLVVAAGACLVVACLLWWTYFGWLKEALEEGFSAVAPADLGGAARDAYSLIHFPLICGIIGFAVAVEEILLHPERPAETAVVLSLIAGIGLFIGASALAYWRIAGEVLIARLAIVTATLGIVALAADADPVWPLTVVAVGLLAVVVTEEMTIDRETAADVHID
jgi:low temperature requirement protein LtrA